MCAIVLCFPLCVLYVSFHASAQAEMMSYCLVIVMPIGSCPYMLTVIFAL